MFRHWRALGKVTVEKRDAEWRQVVRKVGRGRVLRDGEGEGRHRWTLRERPEHSPWGLLVCSPARPQAAGPGRGAMGSVLMGLTYGVSWILLFSLMSMRSLEWPGVGVARVGDGFDAPWNSCCPDSYMGDSEWWPRRTLKNLRKVGADHPTDSDPDSICNANPMPNLPPTSQPSAIHPQHHLCLRPFA